MTRFCARACVIHVLQRRILYAALFCMSVNLRYTSTYNIERLMVYHGMQTHYISTTP
ncbi:hypothetical protein HMPREF9248_0174 [Fannyhessea vaginae PB189-T1-4]|uniref:Uncharacterized protein n=1 Tax=Fannyhessea vaginae PB189-T1-4 TaxID=866774 RepID=A0ABP2IXF8_9ACTN|nr:hypothetical protein HMPREF9248_0174 [Fannyhessea vaginae PB189-T1-4]